MSKKKRLLLANGERYMHSIERPSSGRSPEPIRTYEESVKAITTSISRSIEQFNALDSYKIDGENLNICLRLHPDRTAKSHDPNVIFKRISNFEKVGSRSYTANIDEVTQTTRIKGLKTQGETFVKGKTIFVKTTRQSLEDFIKLIQSNTVLPKAFQKEVCDIEEFCLLTPNEQILGFDEKWSEGRVELVLHPPEDPIQLLEEFLPNFLKECGIDPSKTKLRSYANGPIFISARCDANAIKKLSYANPLRVVHPQVFTGLPTVSRAQRNILMPQIPPAPTAGITLPKVGIFDGGIDINHPHLKGYAHQDPNFSVKTQELDAFVSHGTAVAGCVLYKNLINQTHSSDQLPAPTVEVTSFRCFPCSDPHDIDLYEAIDLIEQAVPARNDIKVFNVSFGPRGPIFDDSISRFTYSLDSLAKDHKVTFAVAVGNDGNAGEYLERIQAPADLVNGFGVAAHTFESGNIVHAPYSCKGMGREGAKVKPDLSAFGGCDINPFHLLSLNHSYRSLESGTSFASPIVSSICAELTESFDRASPLLSRALMIHTADNGTDTPDNLLGYGPIKNNIEDILQCDDDSVTLLFQGALFPSSIMKLPLLLPPNLNIKGKIELSWTVAGLPSVDINHPEDYTTCCILDSFHPNSSKYKYSLNGQKPKTLHLTQDSAQIATLLAAGWKQSTNPVSDSVGTKYSNEADKRSIDLKWESVVKRKKNKLVSSLEEPFLILQPIGRHNQSTSFDFAVAVTLRARNYAGDLHADITQFYQELRPVNLRADIESRLRT